MLYRQGMSKASYNKRITTSDEERKESMVKLTDSRRLDDMEESFDMYVGCAERGIEEDSPQGVDSDGELDTSAPSRNADLPTLAFWSKHSGRWPFLACCARVCFAVSLDSAGPERTFSTASRVLHHDRLRLTDEHSNMCVSPACSHALVAHTMN